MSKRTRGTAGDIRQTLEDPELSKEAKLIAIFSTPKAAKEGEDDFEFKVYPVDVKVDKALWVDVIKGLELIDYESLTETGNAAFGFPEISEILGQKIAGEMTTKQHSFGLTMMTANMSAKDLFMSYMLWYDEDARFHYLIAYAYFLKLKKKLVSYARTQEHPEMQVDALKLVVKDVSALYHVNTYFRLYLGGGEARKPSVYTFRMLKRKNVKEFIFEIVLEKRIYPVPMSGAITSVLKFLYAGEFFIVVSGELDNVLLRFPADGKLPSHVTIVHHFVLDASRFNDVTYGKVRDSYPVPTNTKSATNLRDLALLDLSLFTEMKEQPIRKVAELSKEEKAIYIAAQSDPNADRDNRELKPEEVVIVQEMRGEGIRPERLSELTVPELRAIATKTGHVYLQTAYEYGGLLSKLQDDARIRFVEAANEHEQSSIMQESEYKPNALRCLTTKVVGVPFATTSTFVAMLVRRYGKVETRLYLFEYKEITMTPHAFVYVVLPPFLHTNTTLTTYRLDEMNLIFHTPSIFYVEVRERVDKKFVDSPEDEYQFVTSELVTYDFKFLEDEEAQPKVLTTDEVERSQIFPDAELFEEVRKHNYKVYDYRHEIDPSRSSVYDCLFYRYKPGERVGRLIFYKRGAERPTIIDTYVPDLKPHHILYFKSLAENDNNDLCLMAHLVQEITEAMDGTIVYGKTPTEPHFLKFSVPELAVLPLYNKDKYSLSAQLDKKLTLSKKKTTTQCVFCGHHDGVKDTVTNLVYCDRLCQRLYCKTNRW